MTQERIYTTRRQGIVDGLVDVLKRINGSGEFQSNVGDNVYPRLLFWDEIKEFPAIHVSAGSESRQYQGGGYKDRFLAVTIRCYVEAEDAVLDLDRLLEDVETVLEENSRLTYYDKRGMPQTTHQITVLNIDTDEGVLEPLGVGEVLIQVHY